MLAAIDASGWVLIIGAASITLTQIATMHFAYQRDKLAAQKVEAVKVALEASNRVSSKKLDDIHTLVNNNMAIQLKLNAVTLRRMAGLTQEVGDIEAAAAAEKLYAEHMAKQALVDAG
jgi:hypothetical protein